MVSSDPSNSTVLPNEQSSKTELGLQHITQAAEALRLDDPSLVGFHDALFRLSDRHMKLKLALHRAEYMQAELQTHVADLEAELALLHHWRESLGPASGAESKGSTETIEALERRRQVMIRKAKEYQTQLAQLEPATASSKIRISDLMQIQEQNKEREKEIRRKRKKLDAFRGLPANADLARLSLVQAMQDLKALSQTREELLDAMLEH
ncbi:hypothetical protein D9757_006743 [Collybiopsis confluens]|uniref:Uncharacterized protein n=1 Tax=Collybiopsis confluens TaxID=2823264 RepID=A0A8H5HM27_9AGAR|nr:hypothetical protein D9757_006743 [Collybiopsis confluens]